MSDLRARLAEVLAMLSDNGNDDTLCAADFAAWEFLQRPPLARALEDAERVDWLLSVLPFVGCEFDATYDTTTQKPAASFRYLHIPESRRAWDTGSDSLVRLRAAIDAARRKT